MLKLTIKQNLEEKVSLTNKTIKLKLNIIIEISSVQNDISIKT